VATSPEARSSRNASAETATATRTARPSRFSAKLSMRKAQAIVNRCTAVVPGRAAGANPEPMTTTVSPRSTRCSWIPARALSHEMRERLAGMTASRSFPVHLPEPRHLVRIGDEREIPGGDVEGRDRVERQHLRALGDQPERLGVGRLAFLRIDDGIAA